MASENEYIGEMIRTVEYMSRQLVEFRQDINRAMTPLYPRIVSIEKRQDDEARERPQRQRELDQKLASQNAVASQQGAAIQQVISTVKAQGEVLQSQSETLAAIYRRALWGRVFDALMAATVIGAILYWAWR